MYLMRGDSFVEVLGDGSSAVRNRGSNVSAYLLSAILLVGVCHGGQGDSVIDAADWSAKIGFDPALIGADGLYGPPDGLRAFDYELCVPDSLDYRARVSAIDPSLRFSASPGRIGCTGDEVLALGNSHQPGFHSVLEKLAKLDFVKRIEPAWFE